MFAEKLKYRFIAQMNKLSRSSNSNLHQEKEIGLSGFCTGSKVNDYEWSVLLELT